MWQRGAEVAYLSAKALDAKVRADSKRWAGIAQSAGATAD
jgi:tripartite-type tricarboxylate transporter receptor subunit TctC